MSNINKCIFKLRRYCVIESVESIDVKLYSQDFIKTYCAMCVKTTYAKAKLISSKKNYVVVNTL